MEFLSMIHPFDILTLDNCAKLIFTPCPGTKGVSIVDSLKSLKEAGAQTVITMMTMAEMTEKQADTLPSLCAELRMDWYHLPVEDSCAPEAPFAQAFAQQKDILLGLVESGATMVTQNRMGLPKR
ncbi:MAG: hypothetical protein E6503_29465 [Klebsiella michiganensis]|nr:hypothetical protein [Klebsiella michiganensis]